MKKHIVYIALASFAGMALLTACSPDGKSGSAESMESIQKRNGIPVTTRRLAAEPFAIYRKYPTELMARSESTAYAALRDVVREVNVKMGERVRRDEVIVSFSKDNPSYQQALANFGNAESTFKRSSELFAQAGISKQEFENIRTQYDLARTAFKSAADTIEVKAPIDGYITRINVRPTENVSPGDPLFTVTNSDGFEARLYATTEEAAAIRVGAAAIVEAYGVRLEGRVAEVSLVMDRERKAFPVAVRFSGEGRGLASGVECDVAVELYRNEAAIVVGRGELSQAGGAWVALTVHDGEAVARKVVVGRDAGAELEILSGLAAGDLLISEARDGLAAGAKVMVVDSDAE